jgi:formylglycine-generating enzyme required for sulfatase activity
MKLLFKAGGAEHSFNVEDFPVAFGLDKDGGLTAGVEAEKKPSFWLLFHQDRVSIQPEPGSVEVLFNEIAIDQSRWLEAGDSISVGSCLLDTSSVNGVLSVKLTPRVNSELDNAHKNDPASDSGEGQQATGFGKEFTANPNQSNGDKNNRLGHGALKKIVMAFFVILAVGVVYVLSASAVYLKLSPSNAKVSVSGLFPVVPISERYLAISGTYSIEAMAPGYRKFRKEFLVGWNTQETFNIALRELPGFLNLSTSPIEDADILVDGKKIGTSSGDKLKIEAGKYKVQVISKRYFPESRDIVIEGKGKIQDLEITLKPAWGELLATTIPDKAEVQLNGRIIGLTPLKFSPLQGPYKVRFFKKGWKPIAREMKITAAATTDMGTLRLERIDGFLDLESSPKGATVLVDGKFKGRTPVKLRLVSEKNYQLKLSKQGYVTRVHKIKIEGNKTMPLSIKLAPEYGTVFLTTTPAGAALKVDGRPRGRATQRLRLSTITHSIEIRKTGFLPFRMQITPRKGVSKKLNVVLKTAGAALREKAKKGIFAPGGQKLKLVYIKSPKRFKIGSSRRERGRRSNETESLVELSRSFLISEKEVTNGAYKKFHRSHSSGYYRGTSLQGANQPVVNVSWDDAARYANWLSKKEGLKPVYQDLKGKVIARAPIPNGYRLPTEAEWEYVSRYEGGKKSGDMPYKFAWGNQMPPPAMSGNYADSGAKRLPFTIPNYKDGYYGTAPVGKFKPNRLKLYDLGGNVSEWSHDYYDVRIGASTSPLRDPSGPRLGKFHVIKGASWRSGSISELRLTYRDYAMKPRNDIGFRIVRYVDNAKTIQR